MFRERERGRAKEQEREQKRGRESERASGRARESSIVIIICGCRMYVSSDPRSHKEADCMCVCERGNK